MREIAFQWITRHGYAGIFSLLVFGIIGLPVPDEWLLTFSGYLTFKHTLQFFPTFLAAFLGSVCGITVSYMLGRIFDTYVLVKYGWIFHLTPERLRRVHTWFEQRGRWTLTVGYFIPGVRHFTAYAAGMSEVEPHMFGIFAYSGACIWVATFIGLGYFLGERWEAVQKDIEKYFIGLSAAGAALVLLYFLWWRRRARPR